MRFGWSLRYGQAMAGEWAAISAASAAFTVLRATPITRAISEIAMPSARR